MVKSSYIYGAQQKDRQPFTMSAKITYKSYNQNDNLLFPSSCIFLHVQRLLRSPDGASAA